jgi:hypothetical protein
MPHFKQVPPKPVKPVSFVKAVTESGDDWKIELLNTAYRGWLDDQTSDRHEAIVMQWCETGVMSRA